MPVAFTQEKQYMIIRQLQEIALTLAKDIPVRKIKVEQLTAAAGISKGAFYKFYPSKEALFYELLRQLHKDIYSPALATLTDESVQDPADALCKAILECFEALNTSDYKRFWLEDSLEIMKAVSEEEKLAQYTAETELFRSFLNHFGTLAVSEELAFNALRALIGTVYNRKSLEPNYETILRWMAQGVCSHIFL
ncbi:MAG: TetR/AcrR family transcriptional regulator [Lachnospiraceae bacterium]|nr:TetR/AcrR family transcriptional regulator [Lachnospiraceae bacterium]